MTRTGKVLVLGEDTRSFLSVVRSLGRYGLEVHASWCPFNAAAAHSHYLYKIHRSPVVVAGDDAWLEALADLIQREQFDLVIPCHDAAMLLLQTKRERLESAGRIYLLDNAVFETVFSKDKTHELGSRLGIRVPKQIVATTADQVRDVAEEWRYPVVLKPPSSASLHNPFARKAVKKVWNADEVDSALRGFDLASGVQVQENFIGYGIGVEFLARNGEVLTALQHERVHEPLMGGGSSYRKTVALDRELLEATKALVRATSYTGVGMVEFKQNPVTREWVLIEINGRFWGSLPLALAAGMDFPKYLYQMLCEEQTEFPREYRKNLYCRNWSIDFYWMKANLLADHTNPALMTVPMSKVLGEIVNFCALRERSDTLVLDDPRPAYHDLMTIVEPKLRCLRRSLPGARQDLRRGLVERFGNARSVLVMCKGNICRSPFAEKALKRIKPELQIRSAGFYPIAGRRTPEAGVEAAQRFGIDLCCHRSQIVTADLVSSSDLILIFDDEHRAWLEGYFPESLDKVHYLGALETSGPLEIADPYGGDVERFTVAYDRVFGLIESLSNVSSRG